VAVGASAVGPDKNIRKAAGMRRGNDIVVTLTPLPTDARLELSVSVQLKTRSGLVLTPVATRFKFGVQLAKEFPLVRPAGEVRPPSAGGFPDRPHQGLLRSTQLGDCAAGSGRDGAACGHRLHRPQSW
jgi:hypothetical protein